MEDICTKTKSGNGNLYITVRVFSVDFIIPNPSLITTKGNLTPASRFFVSHSIFRTPPSILCVLSRHFH